MRKFISELKKSDDPLMRKVGYCVAALGFNGDDALLEAALDGGINGYRRAKSKGKHAEKIIKWEIRSELRRRFLDTRLKYQKPLVRRMSSINEAKNLDSGRTVYDDLAISEALELQKLLLGVLDKQEKEVFKGLMEFGGSLSKKEMALKLKVSPSRVSQVRKCVLSKIERLLLRCR